MIIHYIIIILILFLLIKKPKEIIINEKKNIVIVYYVYLNENNNWKDIILSQLKDIKKSGILDHNLNIEIEIVISANNNMPLINNCIKFVKKYFNKILFNNYNIETYNINHYEYPGINKLYMLSKKYPDGYFVYMHSKGMSYNKGFRTRDNKILTKNIIYPWNKIINILNNNNNINKVTLACSSAGFGWFNFYWVKASHLLNVKPPIITSDRYYYESWVGHNGSNTYKDCYNIINPNQYYYSSLGAMTVLLDMK